MSDLIKFKKGVTVNLPTLNLAEPALTTDEERLYIGGNNGNIALPNKQDIDSITSQLAEKINQQDSKIPLQNMQYKGINIWYIDDTAFNNTSTMDSIIKQYKADGLNTIVVCSTDKVDLATNTFTSNVSIAAIQNLINIAKNNDMKVIFKVMISDTTNNSHTFTPTDINSFFTNYTNLLTNYANNLINIDMFCIGCEMSNVSNENKTSWSSLITSLKSIISVPITYDGLASELISCVFWDLVDIISVNEYPIVTDHADASVLDMYRGFQDSVTAIETCVTTYNKPLIIQEFSCWNVQGSAIKPWNYTFTDPVIDNAEQANFYDAGFRAYSNLDNVVGLCIWALTGTQTNNNPDCNFLNKPAEDIVKGWWS